MEFTPYLTALVMLLGIIVGTIISPRIQNKIGIEFSRRDLIFKKKLEYFENIIDTIEKNKKLYNDSIYKIENSNSKNEIEKITDKIKSERKHFSRMASPIYFNTKNISEKIIYFVRIEKNIFRLIQDLIEDKKEETLGKLKEYLKKLYIQEDEILFEMKKELSRS